MAIGQAVSKIEGPNLSLLANGYLLFADCYLPGCALDQLLNGSSNQFRLVQMNIMRAFDAHNVAALLRSPGQRRLFRQPFRGLLNSR